MGISLLFIYSMMDLGFDPQENGNKLEYGTVVLQVNRYLLNKIMFYDAYNQGKYWTAMNRKITKI